MDSNAQPTQRTIALGNFFWALSLFLLGAGSKFFQVFQVDSPLPFWDQWDAEAVDTYLPYFHHSLRLSELFRAHNEHRIVLTKVYGLVLLILNGQWDTELQTTINAVIHSATIAGFGWLMVSLLGWRKWPLIWLPLMVIVVSPFNWENTLTGFQSQFYFLLLFSLLTMWFLVFHYPGTLRWCMGVATGIVALFTMASGFMAATAVAVLAVVDIAKDRRALQRQMPTLFVCLVITVAGLMLRVDVPQHRALQPYSWDIFKPVLATNLAWPALDWPWFGALNLLPLILLGWAYAGPAGRLSKPLAAKLTLIIGVWTVAQVVALVYSRAILLLSVTSSRYMDVMCFIMVANCFSLILLWDYCPAGWGKKLAAVGIMIWCLFCVTGLVRLNHRSLAYAVPYWKEHQHNREKVIKAFLHTDDIQIFEQQQKTHPEDLAHPDYQELAALLRDPDIQRILPEDVRQPIFLSPATMPGDAFIPNGSDPTIVSDEPEAVLGSFGKNGAREKGAYESTPIQPGALPYLQFWVAGDFGQAGLSLGLKDLNSGKITEISGNDSGEKAWRKVYVKRPGEPFKVVARDESDTGWFAFSAPVELGRWSYWSVQILKQWLIFLVAGMASSLLAMSYYLWLRFKTSPVQSNNSNR